MLTLTHSTSGPPISKSTTMELFSLLPSEPCPPTHISSSFDCGINRAVISWNESAGADFYTAMLTQEDGEDSNSCMSEDNQCAMPNVRCGQNYTVTVVASNNKCSSDPSEPQTLQSGELFPQTSLIPH